MGSTLRDLLEITLESDPGAYLVPAHIWTPWFAALGSQSGFDSIIECYGDLADHIFAVETGLSSDPAMNFRVSFLDRYRLTSSSDAHSPARLGREATLFECDRDYGSIRRALETGEGYVGTAEFFPEEGKYHLDGHRKCEVRLTPRETIAHGGRCPVCGAPLTVGVAHRVEVLADRGEDVVTPPPTAGVAQSLVPLHEVLSEIAGSGPGSKTVEGIYDRLIAALGPESFILGAAPLEDIGQSSLLAEAVGRLRAGRVIRDAGYDGEYGRIRLFADAELKQMTCGELLFEMAPIKRQTPPRCAWIAPAPCCSARRHGGAVCRDRRSRHPRRLDVDQRAAAERTDGPLLIVAGPGSGDPHAHAPARAPGGGVRGARPASLCHHVDPPRRRGSRRAPRPADPADLGDIRVETFDSLGLAILRETRARRASTAASVSPRRRIVRRCSPRPSGCRCARPKASCRSSRGRSARAGRR